MTNKQPARDDGAVAMPRIHPSAVVHPEAKLAAGVIVGPCAVIGSSVELGADTEVGAHVVIEGHTTIGRRNRILHGAVIGSPPQDLKYEGGDAAVIIGDGNTIREYVTVNIATEEEEATRIGDNNLLMAYVHVAHNCVIRSHTVIANAVQLAGHVQVDDHAILGGASPVHQFVVIGAHAFVGGFSRISQDVPPFFKVSGNPAEPAGINSIGLMRRGFDEEQIARIKRAYRSIYRRGLRIDEALEQIMAEGEGEVAQTFQDFFSRSTRGIIR